jgi:peptidoglycan/xylan/chitin deacetylase (PgdA/CDA1 family)
LKRDGATVVLAFHRVLTDADLATTCSLEGIIVRERTFEKLASFLTRHCHVTDISRRSPCPEKEGEKPQVSITFDDGWHDNVTTAFPIVTRHNLPIVIFVCPGLMGQRQPFWPERAIHLLKSACLAGVDKRLLNGLLSSVTNVLPMPAGGPSKAWMESMVEGFKSLVPTVRETVMRQLEDVCSNIEGLTSTPDTTMAWTDFETLRSSGVTFGSHTQSHPILTQIPQERVHKELRGSKAVLEERMGSETCRFVAYPNGSVSEPVRLEAFQTGYQYAFTIESGTWNKQTDPLLIPRINIWEGKLVNPFGHFSRAMAEYNIFWQAYRSSSARASMALVTEAIPLTSHATR